eukprot:GHVU01190095.1.p2 GENE.GHVU01190095.1~~GHVU01190095.1.p2  ORF type:complete len:106 (+),score=7.24 GHVU01190095.1:1206-1523(+)
MVLFTTALRNLIFVCLVTYLIGLHCPRLFQLDTMLASKGRRIDSVMYFKVQPKLLERRITGRRVHVASGRMYHIETKPPKVPNLDDVGTLYMIIYLLYIIFIDAS